MAADGKSLITSVGSEDSTVWLHDKDGDHQISSEGNAGNPTFNSEGNNLYYLMANGQTDRTELWVRNLASGTTERLLPGYSMDAYSVSRDGKQVAFSADDPERPFEPVGCANQPSLLPRCASPHQPRSTIPPISCPMAIWFFAPSRAESNFLYRMKVDGTGRRKISPARFFDILAVSPDGRWVVAAAPISSEEHTAAVSAFAGGRRRAGSRVPRLLFALLGYHWDTHVHLLSPNCTRASTLCPCSTPPDFRSCRRPVSHKWRISPTRKRLPRFSRT